MVNHTSTLFFSKIQFIAKLLNYPKNRLINLVDGQNDQKEADGCKIYVLTMSLILANSLTLSTKGIFYHAILLCLKRIVAK
jgi:hypothetical protein